MGQKWEENRRDEREVEGVGRKGIIFRIVPFPCFFGNSWLLDKTLSSQLTNPHESSNLILIFINIEYFLWREKNSINEGDRDILHALV